MKELYYLRHSDKENQNIGRAGLDLAAKHIFIAYSAQPEPYTDFFHGPILRTAQTLLATVTAKGMTGTVHPPIEEIGTDELFTEWKKWCKFGQGGRTNLQALQEGLISEAFEEAKANAKKGVEKMFDLMTGDSSLVYMGLAYGHSPVIECAMVACGHDPERFKLDSLEGAVFVQDDNGEITVKEVIRITR